MSCCTAENKKVCPAKMHDGRAFTDYRPRCITTNSYMNFLNNKQILSSSYESRLYLQNNAEALIEKNRVDANNRLLCGVCPKQMAEVNTMEPERYMVVCDGVTCKRYEVNPSGIGDGRIY